MDWIDIHTHLHMIPLPTGEVLQRAMEAGVSRCITIATEPGDWQAVLSTAQGLWPQVGCSIGVHPHSAKDYSDDVELELKSYLYHPYVVAVGEMGLDYHYENADPKHQQEVFRRQVSLACQARLPIQVHSREAEEDTLRVLQEFSGALVGGVIHCFTGTWELAKGALDLGLDISVSGIITFKNAKELREVLLKIPLEHLHLETDAPYLAPVPYRGKLNESSYLPNTAQALADLRGLSMEALSARVKTNTLKVFHRLGN